MLIVSFKYRLTTFFNDLLRVDIGTIFEAINRGFLAVQEKVVSSYTFLTKLPIRSCLMIVSVFDTKLFNS